MLFTSSSSSSWNDLDTLTPTCVCVEFLESVLFDSDTHTGRLSDREFYLWCRNDLLVVARGIHIYRQRNRIVEGMGNGSPEGILEGEVEVEVVGMGKKVKVVGWEEEGTGQREEVEVGMKEEEVGEAEGAGQEVEVGSSEGTGQREEVEVGMKEEEVGGEVEELGDREN